MAKTMLRKEMMLDWQEVALLGFAMKVTGLDMTTTMRLLMRRAVIDMIVEWRQTRVPKLPANLQKVVDEL